MGVLYLVATPIGNLEDITLRALRVLKEVPLIAAEDTRHTARLLRHYGIATPMVSYHEHSPPARLAELLARLDEGDLALVSDAGSPGISDPGFDLVRAAWEAGHRVEPVPGPSAAIAAVAASGLVPDAFLYLGFPPRRARERRERFAALARLDVPLVLYEAPHRLAETLADLEATLGDRPLAICRELTKVHEEIDRTTVRRAREAYAEREPRGEFVLVVGVGERAEPAPEAADVEALLKARLAAGESPSAAAREVARATGLPRSEVYRRALALREAAGDGQA